MSFPDFLEEFSIGVLLIWNSSSVNNLFIGFAHFVEMFCGLFIYLVLLVFETRFYYVVPGWAQAHYLDQIGLELTEILLMSTQHWN